MKALLHTVGRATCSSRPFLLKAKQTARAPFTARRQVPSPLCASLLLQNNVLIQHLFTEDPRLSPRFQEDKRPNQKNSLPVGNGRGGGHFYFGGRPTRPQAVRTGVTVNSGAHGLCLFLTPEPAFPDNRVDKNKNEPRALQNPLEPALPAAAHLLISVPKLLYCEWLPITSWPCRGPRGVVCHHDVSLY